MARALVHPLCQLARLYGVQTAYYDLAGRGRHASEEALLLVLRALGAPVETFHDVPAALRERQQALGRRCVEPVIVAWRGRPAQIELRLLMEDSQGSLACRLELEGGEARDYTFDLDLLPTRRSAGVEGVRYITKRLVLPEPLPCGYHHLTLEMRGAVFRSMIVSTPRRAYPSAEDETGKVWGLFMPLYALHSQGNWGAGDLGDLEAVMAWVAELGGKVVATLPFLASFLDEPFDPSPYAPASRLFWNEFYIDINRVPELESCPEAQTLLQSPEIRGELAVLRSSPLVDYRRVIARKREVLEVLAARFFAGTPERQNAFHRFVETHPEVETYARFRATGERRRATWWVWPQRLRDGSLKEGDYDEGSRRYHLYTQWLMHQQLQAFSEATRNRGQKLYLDLPLGVHPDGYDVWRERLAFALDMSAGAPPDSFFTRGQDWGFPPLHPERLREQCYRYYIACLRHHLEHAGILRIDHFMSLHRLFWIPKGMEAAAGVYVRYPAEELYAILSLESHRHHALIVGEDLGTVPGYVRPNMARHNIHRTYVLQYEVTPDPVRAASPVSVDCAASLNTHDMPTFAAFWQGLDIEDRLYLGLLDDTGAQDARKGRQALREALVAFLAGQGRFKGSPADAHAVLKACLAYLSASPARLVLVNLEDLWLETRPQNVPGTQEERPNWRRKGIYSLEEFTQMPEVLETLKEIERLRRQGR